MRVTLTVLATPTGETVVIFFALVARETGHPRVAVALARLSLAGVRSRPDSVTTALTASRPDISKPIFALPARPSHVQIFARKEVAYSELFSRNVWCSHSTSKTSIFQIQSLEKCSNISRRRGREDAGGLVLT